jgi:hypothetical protein
VRSRIRGIKHGENNCTVTVLLVGIPNVGKSAIVHAMHQIGRIGAAGDADYLCFFERMMRTIFVLLLCAALFRVICLMSVVCPREGKAQACNCDQPSWRN